MLEKPVIFLGHHRIDHLLGNFVVGNRQPVLDKDFPDLLSRAVIDHTGRFHLWQFLEIEGFRLGREFRDKPSIRNQGCQTGQNKKNHGHKKP